MKYILNPTPIAEKCFLIEALYWVAFNIYPEEAFITENGKNMREDTEYHDQIEINIPEEFDSFFTEDVCKKYGLPKSYLAEYIRENHDYPFPSDHSQKTLDILQRKDGVDDYSIDEEEIEQIKRDIAGQKEFEEKQNLFNVALENFLEVPKMELFIALKKKKLKVYSRYLIPDDEDGEDDGFLVHTEMTYNKFEFQDVKWNDSMIEGDGCLFPHVLIDVKSLFSVFPESDLEVVKVNSLNGIYIIDDNNKELTNVNFKSATSGRKPKVNWDLVHPYIAKRIKETGWNLSKQDALADEVKTWIKENLKEEIGISTIKAKLKPYWDLLKSEN